MRLLFLAVAAWVVYRIAQENGERLNAPTALLPAPKKPARGGIERAVM